MRYNYILYPALQEPTPQQQGETVFADKWIYPWSEPVRFRTLHTSLIVSGGLWHSQPIPPINPWFMPLSEPVREPQRLHAALNPYQGPFVLQPPGSATLILGWFTWLSEPVRELQGLRAPYQEVLAYHPRVLPTPNVTLTLDATETNTDDATFGINITASSTASGTGSASVSITEIPAMSQGAMSIREP